MFTYQLGDISKYAAVHKRKIFQLNREDFKYFRGCKTGSQKIFYLNHLYLLHIHINSLNKVSLEMTIYIYWKPITTLWEVLFYANELKCGMLKLIWRLILVADY